MKRGALAAALLVAAGGCARVDPDAAAVAAAADGFLAAQRDGAWPRAFESLHVNLRRRCDSVEALRAAVDAAATIPLSWTLDPPSVGRYTASLHGAVQHRGGVVPLSLAFDRVDGGWAITAWAAGEHVPCRDP
ncbi:MAG TPA: hypothetical protein VFO79_13360 [Xanthomonadales bacterium]|nr:hypothetical protein [Xanthomonadales bacterium]